MGYSGRKKSIYAPRVALFVKLLRKGEIRRGDVLVCESSPTYFRFDYIKVTQVELEYTYFDGITGPFTKTKLEFKDLTDNLEIIKAIANVRTHK